jgi:hypothetical protein
MAKTATSSSSSIMLELEFAMDPLVRQDDKDMGHGKCCNGRRLAVSSERDPGILIRHIALDPAMSSDGEDNETNDWLWGGTK